MSSTDLETLKKGDPPPPQAHPCSWGSPAKDVQWWEHPYLCAEILRQHLCSLLWMKGSKTAQLSVGQKASLTGNPNLTVTVS